MEPPQLVDSTPQAVPVSHEYSYTGVFAAKLQTCTTPGGSRVGHYSLDQYIVPSGKGVADVEHLVSWRSTAARAV